MQAAVEFLLVAKQPQQAFEVAQTHGQMDAYVRFVGSNASSDDCVRIAMYYEARGNFDMAARLFSQSGQPHKALLLYIQVIGFSSHLPFPPRFALFCIGLLSQLMLERFCRKHALARVDFYMGSCRSNLLLLHLQLLHAFGFVLYPFCKCTTLLCRLHVIA